MGISSTRQRPSSLRSSSGISLVDLLVAMTVTLGVMAGALSLSLSSRQIIDADQRRTAINQNLRNAMDLIGIDIRQAGARLPLDFPALEILDGGPGSPDTLIVRRNVLLHILPVCVDIAASSTVDVVSIALTGGGVPPGCSPLPDSDGDGVADNLQAWKDHRTVSGGATWAFIFNPRTQLGEFFLYDGEDEPNYRIEKGNPETWRNSYSAADQSRVYMIEERTLSLDADGLSVLVNQDPATRMNLLNTVSDFQATALFVSKPAQATLGPLDDWKDLDSIEIRLVGESTGRNGDMSRALVTRYLPRNVLSR